MEIICNNCGRVAMLMQQVAEIESEEIIRAGPYCATCEEWLGEHGEVMK